MTHHGLRGLTQTIFPNEKFTENSKTSVSICVIRGERISAAKIRLRH